MNKNVIIIILFLFLSGISCFGQNAAADKTDPGTKQPDGKEVPVPVPEPYTEEEFPEWMLDLRRGEIVFFGTLPFTFLIALEVVDVGRYYVHGQDPLYKPWPFRGTEFIEFSTEDKLWIIGSALFLSLTAAVVDFFINKAVQASRREQQRY